MNHILFNNRNLKVKGMEIMIWKMLRREKMLRNFFYFTLFSHRNVRIKCEKDSYCSHSIVICYQDFTSWKVTLPTILITMLITANLKVAISTKV